MGRCVVLLGPVVCAASTPPTSRVGPRVRGFMRMVGPATPGAVLRGGAVGWLGRSDLRLRILLVCDSLDIGGAERHVIGLAAGLKRRGHDVTIACSKAGPLRPDVVRSGIALRVIAAHLGKRRVSISYTRLLEGLLSGGGVDLFPAQMHASAA